MAERRNRAPVRRRRKRARGIPVKIAIPVLIVLMVVSFFAGRYAGIESTKYHGKILLVNSENRLSADYVPEGLVNLYNQRHSFRLASSDIYLTRAAYEAAQQMFAAAEAANVNGFIITSGYRDYARQAEVYAESEAGKAQEPGASEHQTGLAFDVTAENNGGFETTPQYAWLCQHAHEYGFIQRYPANKADETGISYEPWHYRYVGVKAATAIHGRGITLEAYIKGGH
ncbi:MAG: M15 family metallopeptidase [Clostridia bacterium]|nr:M15 family metallopeptidase [Clostridia bacterium]